MCIPAGWFWMGSDAGQGNERPVHRVWVDAFRLASCQVTNAAYAQFVLAAGRRPPPFATIPVSTIQNSRWLRCPGLRLRSIVNGSARARACVTVCPPKPSGNAQRAVVSRTNSIPGGTRRRNHCQVYEARWKHGPEPAARDAPNAFGLYDICENVYEWCSDWYQADYYSVSPERSPTGPEQGSAGLPGEAPGAITSKPAVVRRVPASLRISLCRLRLPSSVRGVALQVLPHLAARV